LRDLVFGREIAHEWLRLFVLHLQDREKDGFRHDIPEDLVAFWSTLPQVQVAVSMKTRYHRNPAHRWKINHIADIDALAIAYAYCDALLTDAEARAALTSSRELRSFGANVPRNAQEMADWLDGLPPLSQAQTPTSSIRLIRWDNSEPTSRYSSCATCPSCPIRLQEPSAKLTVFP
jgi:hypothetical protein